MQLDEYFDFLTADDIRIKGTRIGIETVLYEYLHGSQAPEAIAERYPSLSLEQVYATITYYLHNPDPVRSYLTRWLQHGRVVRGEQERNPPAGVSRLRRLKREREVLTSSAGG